MFCINCGKEISENAKFCVYCGCRVQQKSYSLLERACNKEQEALAEIYNQSSSTIYRVIRVLIKDEDTAFDILQDTYIKAFTRLDQLQDETKLVPWLKMIATNTAKDWLKKTKPVFFADLQGGTEEGEATFEESIEETRSEFNPEVLIDENEVRRLVQEILDQLPEDQRLVIGMFYYEEMSVKEIASILEISDNTVKSRLNYGRKKIKDLVMDLEEKGTKIYTIAPLPLFIYLLRKLEGASEDAAEAEISQKFMNVYEVFLQSHEIKASLNEAASNPRSDTQTTAVKETEKTPIFNEKKKAESVSNIMSQAGSAAGKTTQKVVGRAVSKELSSKIIALAVVGAVGTGGAYGVVNLTDKFPLLSGKTEIVETANKAPSDLYLDDFLSEDPMSVEEFWNDAYEETIADEGEYGGIYWCLFEDGKLFVMGDGPISNDGLDFAPWKEYDDIINKIYIGNGITSIGEGAFSGLGYVNEIIMADTVTEIREGAFWGVLPRTADPGIEVSVTFSKSLETIESYAFFGSNINAVELPDSVKTIGDYAFRKCYCLRELTIGENSSLEYIGCQAFENSPLGSNEIYIPSSVKCIKSDAFVTGNFVDTVTFSDELEELGLHALGGLGLNTVYFMGDAPTITDERIATFEDTIFPSTTTRVFYPEGNETWEQFDFSKLGKNAVAESFNPS